MASSWFSGHSNITYTHSVDPLILPSATSGPARAFPELVKVSIPPCILNPFLFNGHLQTVWTATNKGGPPIHYKRRVFASDDEENFAGHFTIDFAVAAPPSTGKASDGVPEDEGLRDDPTGVGHHRLPPRTTYFSDKEFEGLGSDDRKPLLIALHGLTGGSYEVYLRHVLAPLVEPTEQGQKMGGVSGGDWEALVVNSRGCAGSKITSSILYNARATWDARQAIKWARKTWPNRPLYAVGFSLGANILANYLGEEGDQCVLSGAVVIANAWNFAISNLRLQTSYLGLNVYSKAMGTSTRKLFEVHAEQLKHIDAERIRNVKYLHEFDHEVQCPTWGYATEDAYYRDASSADSVLAIRTPTLCLHAKDDPIAHEDGVAYAEIKQNPYVIMCATDGGGHLGWLEWSGERWHARATAGFLKAMVKNVDSSKIEAPKSMGDLPAYASGHKLPFIFEPMRRKCHLPGSDQ